MPDIETERPRRVVFQTVRGNWICQCKVCGKGIHSGPMRLKATALAWWDAHSQTTTHIDALVTKRLAEAVATALRQFDGSEHG